MVDGDGVVFDAVILRDVPTAARTAQGSIKWSALADAGFRYLGYEADPFRSTEEFELDSGAGKLIFDAVTWVAREIKDSIQLTTDALGAIDRGIRGTTKVTLYMHAVTLDTAFAIPLPKATPSDPQLYDYQAMKVGWGEYSNKYLGAAGLEVRVIQPFLGALIPSSHAAKTYGMGRADLKLTDESGTNKAICMELRNSAAEVSNYLMPKTLCDLREWSVGGLDEDKIKIRTNVDGEYHFKIYDVSLIGLYESDDVYRYAREVLDFKPKRARILTGPWAQTFTSHGEADDDLRQDRLYAPCLNFANTVTDSALYIGLGSTLFPGLSAAAPHPVGGAGILAGTTVSPIAANVLVQSFANIILNTDIVMSPRSKVFRSRQVMSHEYGHYLFCNLLHEEDKQAVSHVVWSTIKEGDDTRLSIRYLNEAVADYFAGQVAGGLDYRWANRARVVDMSVTDQQFCADPSTIQTSLSPPMSLPAGTLTCFEENNNSKDDPSNSADDDENLSVGRIATLLHDAFDGHRAERGAHVPNDADSWRLSQVDTDASGNPIYGLPLIYSPVAYQDQDSDLERVALSGPAWKMFADVITNDLGAWGGGDEVDDKRIFLALDFAMRTEDVTWCDRCRVFALHSPGFSSTVVREMFEQCVNDADIATAMGAPPFPVEVLNADSCLPCDGPPQPDGTCAGECSVDRVLEAGELGEGQSVYSGISEPGDTCPQTFVVEVVNLDDVAPLAYHSTAGVRPIVNLQTFCEQPHVLSYLQYDASGLLTEENTRISVGVREELLPPFSGFTCSGLPHFDLDVADWPSGKMRFEMPTKPEREFFLNMEINPR